MTTTMESATGPAGLAGAVVQLACRLKQAMADLRERSMFRAEIADLAEDPWMLADLGLTPGELDRIVAGYPESGRLLRRMAHVVGVDINPLDAATQYELQRSCSLCDSHSACRRWLDAGHPEASRDFCPNRKLLDALQARSIAS